MSLSISHFKAWLLALTALLLIEIAVVATLRPSIFDRTNFLQFSFLKPETPQRLFTFHKIKDFATSNPIAVQTGDSSGFYGIEPAKVTQHLPEGFSYLNMSCCANLGFNGYYNIMRLMAERNPATRYLVLHITPYTMPRPQTWDDDGAALWGDDSLKVFGGEIEHNFISFWRYVFLPSMAYRRPITDHVFYIGGILNRLDRPLLDNENYFEFLKLYKSTRGWMPENDIRVHVPATECAINEAETFDWRTLSRKPITEQVLEAFAGLAREFNKTLVIVFQPVACTLGTGRGSAKTREAINRFKTNHPEVEIPFPLIETWPSELFSVPAHVKREHIDLIGDRLGKAMAEIVGRRGTH